MPYFKTILTLGLVYNLFDVVLIVAWVMVIRRRRAWFTWVGLVSSVAALLLVWVDGVLCGLAKLYLDEATRGLFRMIVGGCQVAAEGGMVVAFLFVVAKLLAPTPDRSGRRKSPNERGGG